MAEVNRLLEEGLSLVRRLVAEAQAAAELKARLKAEAEARAKAEEEARVRAEAEEAAAEAKAKAGAGDGEEPEAGSGPEGSAAAPLPSPPPSASTPSAPPSEASTATAPPVPPELLPRLVHQLLGFTVHPPDALALVNNEHFGPFIEECTVAAAGPTGHVQFPLHACSVLCNVCAYPSCRDALDPGMMLRATTEALHWFPRNRRLVHLALMTTANFAHCGPRLRLTAPAAEIVARAVIPLCDEAPVVDAWCCALTNLASIPDAAAALLTLGVVGRLQELLLYHGDARLTARGLRCVTAFASAGLPPS